MAEPVTGRYELGATVTYTRRTVLWVGGVGSGDGAMVLTVYQARKMPVNKCYWVEVVDDRVLVWETAGGAKTKAYTVTGGRCSCDGMRKMGAAACKHLSAVRKLIETGHLCRPL